MLYFFKLATLSAADKCKHDKMPSRLMAVHLHRFLNSGRNKPAIFGCVDAEGKSAGDYVVKLSGAMDTGSRAAANELIASMLAEHFGILRPEPAIVRIHPDLIKWLSTKMPDIANLLGRSGELNFATKLITGAATWPTGRSLPEAMVPAAICVFAFDALISNDDRRYNNPNVLVRGDGIDHEAAFSFLYLVPAGEPSWVVRNRRSLRDHVFCYELRKHSFDLGLFTRGLAQLSAVKLEEIIGRLPDGWRHDQLGRISAHLQNARDNAGEFERQLREVLAWLRTASAYVHDSVTAEFVNVGVAVFSTDVPFFQAKCTIQYGRITRMFDRIDGDRFEQAVRYVEEEVNELGLKLWQRSFPFSDFEATIDALLKRVLPPDDSAMQFSPVAYGVSTDLDATMAELYDRYVERYAGQPEIPSRSDDEVWRVFREPLERRKVLSYLEPKKIVAPDFEYEFRAGWKNEIWHVYEPISFDLVEPSSLLDKANRWLGRSTNLAESSEQFQLHLLVGAPQNPRLEDVFRRSRNILQKMSGGPEIVMEYEAERFAADLEHEISIHQDGDHSLFQKG